MKIIDLSLPIFKGMNVYPGDPQVILKPHFSYKKVDYIVTKISMGNHTGTHMDFPSHMIKKGKTSNDFNINYFFGKAIMYKSVLPKNLNPSNKYQVIILNKVIINEARLDSIINSKINILGYSAYCNLKITFIKKLLKTNTLLVGRLTNLNLLPKEFYFSAFPLPIKRTDGSPVRAVAYL